MERNLTPVPESVKENVKRYLEENNLGELVDVLRKSDHPDDDYLYMAIAKKGNTYSCWTSWNEYYKSLNHGHYCLSDVMAAYEICAENFYRMN